jgi:hypothetical protein
LAELTATNAPRWPLPLRASFTSLRSRSFPWQARGCRLSRIGPTAHQLPAGLRPSNDHGSS